MTEADVIRRYYGKALAISRQYFLPGGEPEDLLQEALIGLLEAHRAWRPDGGASFETFANLCVHRQLSTAVKTATRLKHGPMLQSVRIGVDEDGNDYPLVELLPAKETVERQFESRETLRAFAAVNLSPLERTALAGYAAGLTYKEIDQGFGCKAVDNALQRAHKKLARLAA